MKIIFILITLLIINLPAFASGSLRFNSKSFENGLATGAQDSDSYYTISIADPDFEFTGIKFVGATIYIPIKLLENGTYDLVVLKPSKKSNSAKSCNNSDNESERFKLPSNKKIYIELGNTGIQIKEDALVVKGSVATGHIGSGSISLKNVTNGIFGLKADGDFKIKAKVSSYFASIPSDGSLNCKNVQEKVKTKFSYNSKTSLAAGSFDNVIITKSFE